MPINDAGDTPEHHACIPTPLETLMDQTQAAPFLQQLLRTQTELLAQLAAQRGGTIGRAEAAANHFGQPEDSRAQVAAERGLEFALDGHETAHLSAIDAALARIAAGTYGDCTDCGAHITAARLMAHPEAHRCVHCQEKAEHTARH
ncbi:TraR/DksA family transcriptional regulator [Acidovorax sp.]|uniref:TraR/DksA family transcriptional regulator n=1 Tax=Acidovorax sp. TaxID=1872122 RepID=UPI00391C971F